MSNCPKCGYPIAPDETACANCGEPVENTNEENVSPENIEAPVVEENVEEVVNTVEETNEVTDVVEAIEEQTVNPEPVLEAETPIAPEVTPVAPAVMAPEAMVAPSTVDVPQVELSPEVPVEANAMMPNMDMSGMTPMAPEGMVMPDSTVMPQAELPTMPMAPDAMTAPSMVDVPSVELPQAMPAVPLAPNMEMPGMAPMALEGMGMLDSTVMPQTELPTMPMAPDAMMNSMSVAPEMVSNNSILEAPAPVVTVTHSETKKDKSGTFNKVMFILVFLVSLVAIGLLTFFMIKMFSSENITTHVGKTPSASREYHYEGFNLYLEEKDKEENPIHAEIYEGEFYVGSQTWSAVMTLQTGNYNTLVSNKSQLEDYFKTMGYETKEPVEKEISGTAFVKMEVVMGSKNVLVAYAKANGTKLFGIVLENESGEYTDDDLKTIGTIISTSKYVGPKYELPEGFHFDAFKDTFMIAE